MQSLSLAVHGLEYAKSAFSKTLPVDSMYALYLWYIMEQSTTVSSIVDFVSVWTSIAPWIVEIRSRREKNDIVLTDDKLNHLFATQMMGKLELIAKHLLCFGWVVIQYRLKDGIKTQDAEGVDVNVEILHPLEYQVRYKKSKRGNKKYMAFSPQIFTKADKPIPHTRVFVFCEPEPVTGRSTSPLAHALRGIYQYDEHMALQMIVAHKLAFPVHAYKSDMDKIAVSINDIVAQTETHPAGADEDIGVEDVDTQFMREATLQHNMAKISRSVYNAAQMADTIPGQLDNIMAVDGLQEYVKKAIRNPTLPAKPLPPGQSFDPAVPEAKVNPNFDHIENQLKAQICSVLNVPVEFIFPSGSKFSSDIALSKKIMDTRTTRMHEWISVVLKRIFIDIHLPHVKDKIVGIARKLTIEHLSTFKGKYTEDVFFRTGFVLKESLVHEIERVLEISVNFAETTSASAEHLLTCVQTGAIDHEKYQQLLLSSLGIPQSAKAKLSQKEHKEFEEMLKLNQPTQNAENGKRSGDAFAKGEKQVAKRQKKTPDADLSKAAKKIETK